MEQQDLEDEGEEEDEEGEEEEVGEGEADFCLPFSLFPLSVSI